MGKRHVRAASIALAGAMVAAGLLTTAGSGGAATTGDYLFDASPDSIVCGETSAVVTFHVDTGRITDPGPGHSVVSITSPVGDLHQSPGPFGDPDTGSAYWTVPYAELGVATVTWTRRDMSDGTFIADGTFDVDLTSLCGHVATTTTEAPTPTTADPVASSTTTAPAVAASAAVPVATSAALTG